MSDPRPADGRRFLYVAGSPALDLVNTVDWTARGLREEQLYSYEALTRWAEGAGILPAATGRRLRQVAGEDPTAAAAALEYARAARAVLRELFGAIARDERPGAALDRFNELLGESLQRLEVGPPAGSEKLPVYGWHWRGQDTDPRSVMWPVLWSAARMLGSDELRKLRVCDGHDCGWMYLDRSRNGFRRWCQMRTCGTREKTRRRRVSPAGA